MEMSRNQSSTHQTGGGVTEELPSLLVRLESGEVPGFDHEEDQSATACQRWPQRPDQVPSSSLYVAGKVVAEEVIDRGKVPSPDVAVVFAAGHHQRAHSVSLPSSPTYLTESTKAILLTDEAENNGIDWSPPAPPAPSAAGALPTPVPSKKKFYSQPMPAGGSRPSTTPRAKHAPDRRFDSFKTWSGRLERQISNLRGKPQPPQAEDEDDASLEEERDALPVDRYFDALQGPELDVLRPSEESALPEDKLWPFLLRFPISSYGVCLGVGSQAILWKTLASSPPTAFLHVSPAVNFVLWCASLALMACVSLVYALKIIFYLHAVRREYYHPIRVNFFFAPWIACLFLALGVPPAVAVNLHAALWYALMAPILCLELKIYGQWMSGGQRRLSKVANPSNHLSVVGNFVGALLGASMGLKEGPIFFFAVGLAHYTVLFVTLYQRLPTNETLPKELHPVFFLFVAAPSVACMAWAKIVGDFDYGSRLAYFVALFLYASLAVRINFFRGFRFSLAWWAYTFPMTGAAIATIRYAAEVGNTFTQALSVALSAVSTVTVTALLVTTIIHAVVLRDLFPNDISIAVTDRRPRMGSKRTATAPSVFPEPAPGRADAEDPIFIDVERQQQAVRS